MFLRSRESKHWTHARTCWRGGELTRQAVRARRRPGCSIPPRRTHGGGRTGRRRRCRARIPRRTATTACRHRQALPAAELACEHHATHTQCQNQLFGERLHPSTSYACSTWSTALTTVPSSSSSLSTCHHQTTPCSRMPHSCRRPTPVHRTSSACAGASAPTAARCHNLHSQSAHPPHLQGSRCTHWRQPNCTGPPDTR